MSYYTAPARLVYEDTPRDPANGILSLRSDIDWDAIEAENAKYARELREKQKDYPADFFSCDTTGIFNTAPTPAKSRPEKPAPREPIACAVCGATFTPKSKRQKFCSLICKSRDYWSRHAAEISERRSKVKTERACELGGEAFTLVNPIEPRACAHCGKTFTPATRRNKYCSAACARAKFLADNSVRNRAYRAAHKKVYENVCACCGKTWTSNRKAKACSDVCRSKLNYKYEKKGTPRGRKPGR